MRRSKVINIAIILLIIHTSAAKPGKSTAPAVFEVINEQARVDDKRISPYTNPLAGNSLQNAKIHAQHQQAMFNAERMRQHRAQLQRWHKQPTRQQTDSYMKAYQESQENHHLALEQMQSNMKEKKSKRQERPLKDRPQIEPAQVTRGEGIDNGRRHRSYGSIYTSAQKKHRVNTYPGPTYDQGVTIKPNGNVGLHSFEQEQTSGLYTEAIPSKSQYIYPKLYSQMHSYQSANDINTLNTLLTKAPQEQLTQLNTLVQTVQNPEKDSLETPIDLFFYLKDPHSATAESSQTAFGGPYVPEYTIPKDHTPIMEEIEDVHDNNDVKVQSYPILSTPAISTVIAQINDDTTTTKSNYYKIEVEQTISGNVPKNFEYFTTEKPRYENLNHGKPLNFYLNGPSTEGIKYLHSQPTGVQHLSQDGKGVSAYGNDEVSITNNRSKRELDTHFFILGNETLNTAKSIDLGDIQPKLDETLINLDINCNLTIKNTNETLNDSESDRNDTLPTPEGLNRNRYIKFDNIHQIGEAYDYDYSYDDDDPNSSSKFDYDNDESDYDSYYDNREYDYEAPKFRPRPNKRLNRQRKPKLNRNPDADGSFSNRYSNFNHPKFSDYYPEPSYDYTPQSEQLSYDSYGPPLQSGPSIQFGPPSTSYGQPIYGPPVNQKPTSGPYPPAKYSNSQTPSILHSLEPVYVLTESQIKELAGQQKLNIEHLDVFQVSHEPKPKRPWHPWQPKTKYRRRYPKKGRKYKAGKLRKLNKIIRF